MKQAWLVAAAMVAGLGAQAQECRPGVRMLTVYILDGETLVSNEIMTGAKYMATKVLAGASVTVEWRKGERPTDSPEVFCGDRLTIEFDGKAPRRFDAHTVAYASLNAGSPTEIHILYNRVPDRLRLAEYLGHVMAHEIAHALEGVARHSSEGVMKARWSDRDCGEMLRRPLPFAAEDLELIRSHFETRTPQAAGVALVAAKEPKN